MTSTLCRIGDTVQLDEFNHDLLKAMLHEDELPMVLTLEQARTLTDKVRAKADSGMQYGTLLKGFLANLEAVLAA
jgi:hypothetical protein